MAESRFSDLRKLAGLTIPELAELCDYSVRHVYRFENNQTEPNKLLLDRLYEIARERAEDSLTTEFNFIDLFAGIGGMRLGFESIGGRCVYTSEWNKFSRITYADNFPDPDHEIGGDITDVVAWELPPHDVLLAGFPCQPFSIAGVSKKNSLGHEHGFACQTQGTLFFDVARIIEYHRPAAFLLENVKNLERHDKGRTFQIIADTLDELGYYWNYRVIDAKGYVPQHRERIFIAGFRNDTGFNFSEMDVPAASAGPKLASILHTEDGSEPVERPFTVYPDGKVDDKYVLSGHLWRYLKDYAKKHRERGNGFGYGLVGPDDVARTLSARYFKDGSEILIKRWSEVTDRLVRPRRLTPRECARLMGFERHDGSPFKISVSDTQAYKQFGNAVVVPVVKAVANFMKPHIIASARDVDSQPRLPLTRIPEAIVADD